MTSEENNTSSNEKILNHPLNKEMKTSYINYAMSVIIGRALPDARDGLKPVHRRVLYGMHEGGHTADKKFSKLIPHKRNPVIIDSRFARNAGNIYYDKKSQIIRPPIFLIRSCLAISSAASRLVSSAVLSTFFCLIDLPELTSIETKASVGFITKYPPEDKLT